jgi:hypothetical protein
MSKRNDAADTERFSAFEVYVFETGSGAMSVCIAMRGETRRPVELNPDESKALAKSLLPVLQRGEKWSSTANPTERSVGRP